MNPNFHTNQLKDDFIEVMRRSPSSETMAAYDKAIYEQTEQEFCLFQWDYIWYFPVKYAKEIISLGGGGGMIYLSFSLVFEEAEIDMGWALAFISFGLLFSWLLWGALAATYHHYRLSDKAIAIYEHKNLSEQRFSILRGIAWIGVGVCLFAVIEVGFAAFVGAGGAALLAFTMTGVKRDDEVYWIIPYDSILYIQKVKQDNKLSICCRMPTFYFQSEDLRVAEKVVSHSLWCDKVPADTVLEFLKQHIHAEVEIIETEKTKDRINLYQKAKESDITLREVSL